MITHKTTDYKMIEYHELHQYVLEYQEGQPGSSARLLDSFKGFIIKFVHLIKHGVYRIEDYSTRQYLSLYITDELTKRFIVQYKSKPFVKMQFAETVKVVCGVFSDYNDNEITNELSCVLLQMALKYKDYDRPSFHNYVNKCFHYEAYRALEQLIKDPLVRCINNEEYNDNLHVDPNTTYKELNDLIIHVDYDTSLKNSTIPIIMNNASPFESNSLDDNWINGITCNETFNCLSQFERSIIKSRYIDRQTDTQIASTYGLCRATINRKRLQAERKLSVKLTLKKV